MESDDEIQHSFSPVSFVSVNPGEIECIRLLPNHLMIIVCMEDGTCGHVGFKHIQEKYDFIQKCQLKYPNILMDDSRL